MSEIDPFKGVCRLDGREFPAVGLGTYRLHGEECVRAVLAAAEAGYRIIDTATFYENYASIAKAMKQIPRKEFCLVSKVWHDMQAPSDLRKDLERALQELQTDYLDTYFLHWPNSRIPIEDTLNEMEKMRKEGKISSIGLSNVTAGHLKRALEVGVPIQWTQVEMHPFFCDFELLEFCRKHSILVQCWRPLNLGKTGSDPLLEEIAKKYGKTPYQASLRWILQHRALALPGSSDPSHIRENFDFFDFSLSEEEMKRIDARAAKGERYRLSGTHGFTDEFDFSYEQCWS